MKRRKTLDINRMIANNPRIDVEQLVRSMKIVKRLAKSGVVGAGYNLDAPYTKRVHTKTAENFHLTGTHILRLKRS